MGYGKKIFEEARAELERRRQRAESEAEERRSAFYLRYPQAGELR